MSQNERAAAREARPSGSPVQASKGPLVPAKAGTQIRNAEQAILDSGLRGNERTTGAAFVQRAHARALFPFASPVRRRFSSAAKTRSGVTGKLLKRTPMASAMALVKAGRNAASDPSPASLAPNGPCGSLLSTMPTSMGGESSMVGTR